MNQEETTLLGHVLSEVRDLREQNHEDHQAVMAKVDELGSDVRRALSAAAAAHRLGESNALDIEKLQVRAKEQDDVYLEAGGFRRFVARVLHMANEHDNAEKVEQGVQKERARWLYWPKKALEETPRALLYAIGLLVAGGGWVYAMFS